MEAPASADAAAGEGPLQKLGAEDVEGIFPHWEEPPQTPIDVDGESVDEDDLPEDGAEVESDASVVEVAFSRI